MNAQVILGYVLRVFLFPLFRKLETVVIPILAQEAVSFIQHELTGESGDVKKRVAVDFIMKNIKLPFLAKPFTKLIKSQVEATVCKSIDDAVIELKGNLAK